MSDSLGACVVAIPDDTDLPIEVEGGPHITLAYFGDENISNEDAKSIAKVLMELAGDYSGDILVDTEKVSHFGEEGDAVVLTVDSSSSSPMRNLRSEFLETIPSDIYALFEDAQTFPDYKPHLTLGYLSEGYDESKLEEIPLRISLRGLALWNGDTRLVFEFDRLRSNKDIFEHSEVFDELKDLYHEGVARRSGRYPWGSGDSPYQRSKDFLGTVEHLKSQGLSEPEIARGMGITTTQLRARKSIEKNARRQAQATEAMMLKEKGYSNVAIGDRMGINESSVRALLNPENKDRRDILDTTSSMLKDQLETKGMIDVGVGVEHHLGISGTKLKTAVAVLEAEGYSVHNIQVDQLGTGQKTTVKVLAPPGTTYKDIVTDPTQIKTISDYSEDGGRTFLGIETPKSLDSSRVGIRYAEDGGADADGVIYLRRGVDDVSLGSSQYAQVRIAVDGTHYVKGMAMYKDDMPDGVDILFNTNKKSTGNKLDALKPLKDDEDNPFGSIVRQNHFLDKDGKRQLSPLNIVNEEGDWSRWSKNFSSQMLSKQTPELAKAQLDLTYKTKRDEYDEIMSLTNPAVKKKLLDSFADGADASSVHLKAASLPRTANHVILPLNSLKDTEIYAPNYRNGERVALVRHPHGGIFEIPELTVNNKNAEGLASIRQARDSVGINSKVASRLSGADFDGDTVLVIPNNSKKVKSSAPLEGLKDFDPQSRYPGYDGMKTMSERSKQRQMGEVSNLITDMTIRGASNSEIARAVRHSMVVIDAEKHKLNYKQSELDNDIRGLKKKYQARPDGSAGGASTLISRAGSEQRVNKRTLAGVDPKTGKKVYRYSNETYTDAKGNTVYRKERAKSKRLAETDDAFTLVSNKNGTPMEAVYANHSNKLKALANEARKSSVTTKTIPYSPTAKKTYAQEVNSLSAKLNLALKNKPLERQAQLLANATVSAKTRANPDMDAATLKKIKGQALEESRRRVGAKKTQVEITAVEWEAIQSGAISNNRLTQILNNADLDSVKALATPRQNTVMSSAKTARAKSMLNAGYTQAEIADALGVPASTLNSAIGREG